MNGLHSNQVHCLWNGPHIMFYRADAKDAILYGP